ncbi:MAG: hypothetical protein LBM60_02625 [Clostridium sp.]|nr:hypothetical protein [Clostridium sp.]
MHSIKVAGATPGEDVESACFIMAASPPKADAEGGFVWGVLRPTYH